MKNPLDEIYERSSAVKTPGNGDVPPGDVLLEESFGTGGEIPPPASSSPPPVSESEGGAGAAAPPPPVQQFQQVVAPKAPVTKEQAEKGAVRLIAVLEAIMIMALPKAFWSRSLSDEDQKHLEKIERKIVAGDSNFSELELMLIRKCAKISENINRLPFTPGERASLVEPLSEIFFENQISPGPYMALLMAAGAVIVPRILPLIFTAKGSIDYAKIAKQQQA